MVKKWEIYFLDFDPIKGSEQQGARPALVVSNDSVNKHLPIFTVLPFSSVKIRAWFAIDNSWESKKVPAGYLIHAPEILFGRIDREVADQEVRRLMG